MKTISICLLLASSIAAYGQEPGTGQFAPAAGEAQPDASGGRLKQLLRAAEDLERTGQTEQAATVRRKAEQERQSLLARLDSLQAEVERIRQATGGSPLVIVHLKVYEVSLTKLRRLGYNLAKLQGKSVASPNDVKDAVVGGFSMVDDGSEAARFFESLRKDNLAKVLAEPSLTTISGTKAVFNAGGQFPIPRPRKDGSTAMEWQQFGTQVELTPLVRGDRTMRLSVHFRVADLDYTNGVRIGKDTFPSLRVREFTAGTELNDGQTLAFSGLNQVHVEATESGVPVASSIPYIGSAFKSVKEERNEIAMFVLVRPEIVQSPTAAAGRADNAPDATARRSAEGKGRR
jgi:Flp pilus assembly secretin CpaC